MKRFHVQLHVYDLDSNIEFFSSLFGVAPVVRRHDYVQWVLDDPRLRFSLSVDDSSPGLELLGIEADTREELETVREQFARADACAIGEPFPTEEDASAQRHYLIDPQGILWEARRTREDAPSILESAPDDVST